MFNEHDGMKWSLNPIRIHEVTTQHISAAISPPSYSVTIKFVMRNGFKCHKVLLKMCERISVFHTRRFQN